MAFIFNKILVFVIIAVSTATSSPLNDSCTISSYDSVSSVVSSCWSIVMESFTVPGGQQLTMNLMTGATVTVKGTITFEHNEWTGPLVQIYGSRITFQNAGGVFDGQGASYWDGKGGSGSTKPKFFRIKTTGGSTFNDIVLKNCPVQCVSISSASDTTLKGWTLDVSAGDKGGGHNTDGFDLSSSHGITIENAVVKNQDDCVAINQGYNYYFRNMTCSGGHGLSLSVGLNKNSGDVNTVRNVTFTDCVVKDSMNGIHIKTHKDGGDGAITDVTYNNIQLSGIVNYGINIQENYANGGSSGDPVGNVPITNLQLSSVTGTMSGGKKSMAVYILCGTNGCSNWNWWDVSITHAKKTNSCNFTPNGFTC
ncbi:polygalacturonase-like [Rhynchophorus ferrugineus]|uniref:endo-polygalacturonase n=1 Tax=Rhynchophorus ferrugineus TaxID=354439 RepID=A0A834HSV9_RHYFE|nr:hypothetical protein GWI33_020203 [Rhynchophorus ferrugineus]